MRRWLSVMVVYMGFLAGVFVWLVLADLETPFYGAQAKEVFVQIPRGANTSAIAGTLVGAGVLRQRWPFLLYLRWTGGSRRLQAGEYRFDKPTRPAEVAERLIRGDIFYVSVTVPEGLTADETIALITRHGLGNPGELKKALSRTDWISDLDTQANSLEGYLFPDTYRFPRDVGSEFILQTMIREFRAKFTKLLAGRSLPSGRTVHDVVTLASLVEKEAKSVEERGLVASVLTNRLVKRMPLACDPTIIYALKLAGRYDGNIRRVDLEIDSPYNTYTHTGLPPGTVANPGESALEAALSPQPSQYLYYVSRNDGTHFFSKDFRSHSEAVARYQKRVHR